MSSDRTSFRSDERGDAAVSRRLPKSERRRQLLDIARQIVREEGVDRLTLGHLAERAGVSKPIAYDHFDTRSGLLIELYRWIDTERTDAFHKAMAADPRSLGDTISALANAYIDCASDTEGEFSAVGAALTGSEEKARVYRELLDDCVRMFVSVLRNHSALTPAELQRRCIGFVGAGEALGAEVVRGKCTKTEATDTFASLIHSGVSATAY